MHLFPNLFEGWSAPNFRFFSVCNGSRARRWLQSGFVSVVSLLTVLLIGVTPAIAGLTDDHYDGNIFALYAGNGSLVPPRVSLKESLTRSDRPTLMVFYVDDSRDCKEYSSVVSQLDAFYGRAADFIPVNVDALFPQESYAPTDPGYYYKGVVPQTVLLDQYGEIVLNEVGISRFEAIDDKFRELFDLLPRSESVELKRRAFNEVNAELVEE